MSCQDGWCTKADILKDLAVVNGGLGDVDEMFIVRGKKPPPAQCLDSEDDEIILRFGNPSNGLENETPEPDLVGISAMLRMVDDYNRPDDAIGNAEAKPAEQIVISKLNPHVPEFVPKSSTKPEQTNDIVVSNGSSSPKHKSLNICKNNLLNNENSVSKSNLENSKNNLENSLMKSDVITKVNNEVHSDNDNVSNDKYQNCDIELRMGSRIDISVLNAEEIKDIAQKLRCRISDASKTDLKSKREKNVAIATLLKLYSATPLRASPKPENGAGDTSNKPEAIKLFTPEYYETRPPRTNLGTGKVMCEVHGVVVNTEFDSNKDKSEDEIPQEKSEKAKVSDYALNTSQSTSNVRDSARKSLKEEKKSSTPKLDAGQPIMNKYAEATEVQNSIDKVNKWFDKPKSPKPKAPVVCLGPIAFKRKTPVTSSPVSDVDKSSFSSLSSAHQIGQYRPSNYAEELGKKFMERSKTLEKQKSDWWQRAELLMKEKEEAMRKADQSRSREGVDESDSAYR